MCLSLLMAVKAGGLLAQNQSDTTSVKRDSITWNQASCLMSWRWALISTPSS